MLLVLSDQHKEDLQYLTTVDTEIFQEFCRIACDNVRDGVNLKIYQSAAQKLKVPSSTIKNGVTGLVYLLSESAKLMLNEVDFQDSILAIGFKEEAKEIFLQSYKEILTDMRRNLSDVSISLPHYRELEWRVDVQIASRALKQQVEPVIVLKLHTIQDNNSTCRLLQTDPVNLLHMTSTLEAALAEMKTNHCRRIMRNI